MYTFLPVGHPHHRRKDCLFYVYFPVGHPLIVVKTVSFMYTFLLSADHLIYSSLFVTIPFGFLCDIYVIPFIIPKWFMEFLFLHMSVVVIINVDDFYPNVINVPNILITKLIVCSGPFLR